LHEQLGTVGIFIEDKSRFGIAGIFIEEKSRFDMLLESVFNKSTLRLALCSTRLAKVAIVC